MSSSGPFDNHSALFRKAFESASSYEEFLSSGSESHVQKWRVQEAAVALDSESVGVLEAFTRKMNILVLAGVWCGDCARQCPVLAKVAARAKCIDLRFVDNEALPELRDELRIHGAARVPVVVTLSEDFYEVQRFGDRTLATYRRKALRELGAACDTGIGALSAEEMQSEVREWVALLERQHLMLRLSPMLRKRYND